MTPKRTSKTKHTAFPKARPGQSIRGYAREHDLSYRQARQVAFGKTPYERTKRGSAYRESVKIREDSAVKAWREEYPDDPRSKTELLADWKRIGWMVPQHHGKQQSAAIEEARRRFVTQGLNRPYTPGEYRARYRGG